MKKKLSELIGYRNSVEKLQPEELAKSTANSLDKILGDVKSIDPGLSNEQDSLEAARQKIIYDINEFTSKLNEYKHQLDNIVREKELPYIQQSYQQYEDEFKKDSPDYIIERYLFSTLIYREDIQERFLTRIKAHASWKTAGIFIRPETGTYVDPMITCDPLYVLDTHIKLFNDTKKLWNTAFQNRIRYKLLDTDNTPHIRDIPSGQIGLVVALNFFNYTPLDIIKEYFTEIFDLLMPGGTFIFTYNNCDLEGPVRNVENSMCSYTPGRLISSLSEGIGFEIIESVNYTDTNVSWLEVKKPGVLKSMRGGQSIAKIISTPGERI